MAPLVTSSLSEKNQPVRTGWHQAFRHVENGFEVSGVDRVCPWLSAGPCPRHTPKWRLSKKRPKTSFRSLWRGVTLGSMSAWRATWSG